MAIQTVDQLLAALATEQRRNLYKGAVTAVGGVPYSLWVVSGNPPAAGTPAALPVGELLTSASPGAIPFSLPGAAQDTYIARWSAVSSSAGVFIVYDRLYQARITNLTILTEQAITMPGATRYPTGEGVEIWLEGRVVVGTASTATISVRYTNQAGVANRTATVTSIASWPVNRLARLDLQSPDTGVQSVQGVTIGGNLVSGELNLFLAYRLLDMPVIGNIGRDGDAFLIGLPEVKDNAALALMIHTSTTTTGTLLGSLSLAQG